ncbi:protein of unknown function [Filimonas lacunae]|uniref:DUF4440 domain-containing protein n=1 Tax=Filimonas lacunae TaxID=477680 RepID=A0A173MIH8_9BACT|nr:nuclear transport factor 2 family protein [Filimonas lacunae]BAV07276.1 hypothetical protein FLA_3299 [Filimonas lacunae]SIS92159.1 protein of unknown function [Filimonas lacunae]
MHRSSFCTLASLFILVITGTVKAQGNTTPSARPAPQQLYNTIVTLDSLFFSAYNVCDMDTQASLLSDSIEFYHDQGGLMTSKQAILDATKRNICGKVTRELVKGSMEVSPIPGYGAIETGIHKFHNNQEPAGTISHPGKFVIIWKQTGNKWQITRVISLH